jgi:hypothetical protein
MDRKGVDLGRADSARARAECAVAVFGISCVVWFIQGCAEPRQPADPTSSREEAASSTPESTPPTEASPPTVDASMPLSPAELGEVVWIASSSYLREIPFGHCAVQASLSRFRRGATGHVVPESEDVLSALETKLDKEPAALGRLARGYVELFAQARRDVRATYERSRASDEPTPLDPEATRHQVAEVRRLAQKAFEFLGRAAAGADEPSTYAYELAVLHFELEKVREAQSLLGPIPQDAGASESLKEDAQFVLGLSHLEETPDEQWLQIALTHFEAAARGVKTGPSLTGLASACYQAEVLLELGKKEEARAIFRRLSTTNDPSGIHQIATRRLSELE